MGNAHIYYGWQEPDWLVQDSRIILGFGFFRVSFFPTRIEFISERSGGEDEGHETHVKFSKSSSEVDLESSIMPYLQETIKNHKDGKVVKITRKANEYEKPRNAQMCWPQHWKKKWAKAFSSDERCLKQNEFIEYIATAKREATKLSRIEKIVPMILRGEGLNDRYK